MKGTSVAPLFVLLVAGFLLFQGCEENPVNPSVGSGTLLKATIEGQPYTFDINTDDTEYNEVVFAGTVSGSTDTPPVQSIKVTFNYDIDNGTFPRTLSVPDILITVVFDNGGGAAVYQSISGGDSRVTLSASNGTIVDGTFSGTLTNTQNANDKITLTSGEFSARLPR